MTSQAGPQVTVIVAAHNAETTLARAVRSALAEPETAEIIVVDDASTDATRDVARAEADTDTRVRVVPLDVNGGPAAARNHGLALARAPYVAVLDSDDIFLPGRLSMLLSAAPAELIADNILFANPDAVARVADRARPGAAAAFVPVGAADFVRGNLQQRGTARGELGFLKPLLSTAFLAAQALRYDETLRLAEDYDLYLRMLLAGARMRLTRTAGYGAVVRAGSLSARHGTADLQRLHDAVERHARNAAVPPDVARALQAHLAEVRQKRDHRVFLELRRAQGPAAAIRYALGAANRPGPILRQIARDKLRLRPMAGDALPSDGVRPLLPEREGRSGAGALR